MILGCLQSCSALVEESSEGDNQQDINETDLHGNTCRTLNQRRLVMPIVDLQTQTISALDHGLNCGVYDAPEREADLYTVSDLELPWDWVALAMQSCLHLWMPQLIRCPRLR